MHLKLRRPQPLPQPLNLNTLAQKLQHTKEWLVHFLRINVELICFPLSNQAETGCPLAPAADLDRCPTEEQTAAQVREIFWSTIPESFNASLVTRTSGEVWYRDRSFHLFHPDATVGVASEAPPSGGGMARNKPLPMPPVCGGGCGSTNALVYFFYPSLA